MNLEKNDIISTDENPSLWIESFVIINFLGNLFPQHLTDK